MKRAGMRCGGGDGTGAVVWAVPCVEEEEAAVALWCSVVAVGGEGGAWVSSSSVVGCGCVGSRRGVGCVGVRGGASSGGAAGAAVGSGGGLEGGGGMRKVMVAADGRPEAAGYGLAVGHCVGAASEGLDAVAGEDES